MSGGAVARVLVLDDLAASRAWLSAAAKTAFPAAAVVEAGTVAQALALLQPTPDLALVDLGLPDGSGIEVIAALRGAGATTVCVVATVFDDDAHLFPALRAGAQGYVLKDQSREPLAAMLLGIVDGQPPLSPSIARRLLRQFQPAPPAAAGGAPGEDDQEALTAREREVLGLIGKGLTVPAVAQALGLSRHTCAGYVKDIYRKLQVGSRAEATLAATRLGLVGRDAR
ncbi:MAG: response regulator transcription factor [Xanthomonadales bacterium]|nr:response regulator transcription factor [Xanthomonadales bacterium]